MAPHCKWYVDRVPASCTLIRTSANRFLLLAGDRTLCRCTRISFGCSVPGTYVPHSSPLRVTICARPLHLSPGPFALWLFPVDLVITLAERCITNVDAVALVARIMKTALPENAKIAKEAKECMQECVSEFISFITSEGKQSFTLSQFCPLLSSAPNKLWQLPRSVNRKSARPSMARISCLP